MRIHEASPMFNKCLIVSILVFLPGRLYSQNNLEGFIDSALYHNPVISENRNSILQEDIERKRFESGLKTQVDFTTDLLWDPVVKGYGFDEIITDGQVASVLVSFDKKILFKGQIEDHLRSFEIMKNQAGNGLQLAEAVVRKNVTSQYLTTWGDFLQWQYNEEILQILRDEKNLIATLTAENIFRQSDYLTFMAGVKGQELTVSNARLQYRNSLMQLRYISGLPDTSLIILETPELVSDEIPDKESSKFFMQFVLDSLSLQNRLKLIDLEYKPSLSLHADAGYLSSLVILPYKNFGAGIGLKLSVPLYDGRQKELKHSTIDLLKDNNRQQEFWFDKQYQLKIDHYRLMLSQLKLQIDEINDQMDFYHELLAAEKKLIRLGQVEISQYFMILRNYMDVRNELTTNRVKQMMLINEINFLAN